MNQDRAESVQSAERPLTVEGLLRALDKARVAVQLPGAGPGGMDDSAYVVDAERLEQALQDGKTRAALVPDDSSAPVRAPLAYDYDRGETSATPTLSSLKPEEAVRLVAAIAEHERVEVARLMPSWRGEWGTPAEIRTVPGGRLRSLGTVSTYGGRPCVLLDAMPVVVQVAL